MASPSQHCPKRGKFSQQWFQRVVVLGGSWYQTWDGQHLKIQTFFLTFKPNF